MLVHRAGKEVDVEFVGKLVRQFSLEVCNTFTSLDEETWQVAATANL